MPLGRAAAAAAVTARAKIDPPAQDSMDLQGNLEDANINEGQIQLAVREGSLDARGV